MAALLAHGGVLAVLLLSSQAPLPPVVQDFVVVMPALPAELLPQPAPVPARVAPPEPDAPPAMAVAEPPVLPDAADPAIPGVAKVPVRPEPAMTAPPRAEPAPQSRPHPVSRPTPPRPAPARPTVGPAALAAPSAAATLPVPAPPTPALPVPSSAWTNAVSTWLQLNKRYPDRARQRGEQGAVLIRFTVDRGGSVLAASVVRSSGSMTLDEATETLLRGARLPPFDAGMTQAQATLTVTVNYRME